MDWFTGLIIFLLIWWVMLFTVLPWGLRHEHAPDPSVHSPGAPINPNLKRKFIITTLLSLALWGGVLLLMHFDIIDFREISMRMMEEDLTQ